MKRDKKGRFTSFRSKLKTFSNRLAILGVLAIAGIGIYAYGNYSAVQADSQRINELQQIADKYHQEQAERNYKKDRGTLQTILDVCKEENFDPELTVKIASCESYLNPYAVHLNRNGSIDRGLFQFNSRYYRNISNECAFSIECSVKAFIREAKRGRIKNWLCYKKVK